MSSDVTVILPDGSEKNLGPNATGAHTIDESCPVSELVRVAQVYALAALAYCPAG